MRKKVVLAFLAVLFLTPAVLVVGGSRLAVHHLYTVKARESDERTRALLPKVIADLEVIRANPLFPARARTADAALLIHEHVSWLGTKESAQVLDTPSHRALRAFISAHPDWNQEKPDLAGYARDERLASINTEWMRQLLDYDHWSSGSAPWPRQSLERAARTSTSLERVGIRAQFPAPDFNELRQFALVHFVKESAQGRARDGLRVHRQVAILSHSLGLLVGQMVSIVMLRREAGLAAYANVNDWPSFPESLLNRYRNVSWVWPDLLRLSIRGPFPPELEAFLKPEFGLCGAVTEPRSELLWLQGFFSPAALLENDYSVEIAREREFERRLERLCGLEFMDSFFRPFPADSRPLYVDGVNPWKLLAMDRALERPTAQQKHLNPEGTPYLRRVVGAFLAGSLSPSFLHIYEDASEVKPQPNPADAASSSGM